MNQAESIRKFLIKHVSKHPNDLVSFTAEKFAVSRTTVLRHIKTLIDSGKLIKTGSTKQIIYILPEALEQKFSFNLDLSFDEYKLFDKHIATTIKKHVNTKCFDICEYCITEILNNAKDHSRSKTVKLTFKIDNDNIFFSCQDNGVGVFQNLKQALGFSETRETMLELSKGKLTSDPANHTGEGLFFTCRAVDEFSLFANNFCFLRNNIINDWSFYEIKHGRGTQVDLTISRNTKESLKNIFLAYQDDSSLQLTKTDVIIKLAKEHGQRLISRSQAKRVTANLDKFTEITFDFKEIKIVGQGFVDQIFRVFKNQHPEIKLNYINSNKDVEFMIKRGIA